MSSILVTGGCGFIGSHLVDKLVLLGHEVVVIDNLSTGHLSNVKNCKEIIVKDINDNLEDLFIKYKFEYVFHLAAFINLRESIKNPEICMKDNILGSVNLINYCVAHKVKKIIFSSTGGAIYASSGIFPSDEYSVAEPESPYGLSKLTVEKHLKINKKIHDLDYVILRYSNVYGPRQDAKGEAGVISIFINQILENKNLKIFGDGKQSRDFIYVDDVVSANITTLDWLNVLNNRIYNVSYGASININKVAELLLKISKSSVNIEYLPPILGEMMFVKINSNKLSESSGWKPQTDVICGIDKTLRYFEDILKV